MWKQEKGSPRRSGTPYDWGFNLPPPVPCLGVLLPLASGSCVGRPRCQRQLLGLPQVVTLAALLKRCGAVTVLAASYFLACVVLSAGAVRRPNWNRNRWRWQLPVHSETSGHELPAGGGGSGSTFWAGAGPCRSGRRLVGVRGHFAPGLGTTPKQGSAGSRCGGISLRLIA